MGKLAADKFKVSEIMLKIKSGEYSVPRFQRDFVWDHKKVVALLESLERNFPIGVILLAQSVNSPISGRNEVIQTISNGEKKNNALLVVDGQQRLSAISIIYYASTLSNAIKNGEISDKTSKLIKNVIEKVCLYFDESENKEIFINYDDLVEKLKEQRQLTDKEATAVADDLRICLSDINAKVKAKLGNFELHIQTLSEWTNSEIIEIFTSMNTKTKPLTHIDLMNGSIINITNDNFDLLSKISLANKSWKNWGELSNQLFVQLVKIYSDIKLSGINSEGVNYKSDILVNWASDTDKVNAFVDSYNDFIKTFNNTCNDLANNSDIYTLSHLPKEGFLLSIFALKCAFDSSYGNYLEKYNLVIEHVSKRLVNGDYASSPNAKVMEDINNFVIPISMGQEANANWIETLHLQNWEDKLTSSFEELRYKNKTAGLFKLVLATMAAKRPMNLFKNGQVPVQSTHTQSTDTDIHHIIPSNSSTSKEFGFGDILNKIGNLTLLTKSENQLEIRNENLNVYLKDCIDFQGANFDQVMISHYLNPDKIREFIKLLDEEDSPVKIHAKLKEIIKYKEEWLLTDIKFKFFGIKP